VPQNRERVFIIANLRSRGRREILPIGGENTATLKQIIGGCQGERVYDIEGLSCTITGCGGGGGAKTGLYLMGNLNPNDTDGIAPTVTTDKSTKIFIDQSNTKPVITEEARCITSRYTAGVVNRTAMNSAVLEIEAYPILTPDRINKRQNGRRIKNADEPMFTITNQDRHGVIITEGIKVRNGTKQGYQIAHPGDSVDLAYPLSETRRARVGKGYAHALSCSGTAGVVSWNGKIYKAFVYVMVEKGLGAPSESYYNTIKQGFKDWKLPLYSLTNARKD